MKKFWTNLKLVMEKYVCGMHDSLPGVDSTSKNCILIVMSK